MATQVEIQKLLDEIEESTESFLPGRRNNDVCNWFFAKLMLCRLKGMDVDFDFYKNEFNDLLSKLTEEQRQSISEWDNDVEAKLIICFDNYSEDDNEYILTNLWIDQE